MARYTSSFIAALPVETARQNLVEVLQSCGFEVIYETSEYIMAREKPGNVSYSKLVSLECLIDTTKAAQNRVQIEIVAKNEELPLNVDNHCYKLFDGIKDTISENKSWESLKNAIE